jgi:general secretion pathway protein G
MIVVLVIIAIVAALVAPSVIGRPGEARATVAQADLRTIASALAMYRLDNRDYPTTAQGLEALVSRPTIGPEPASWHAEGYLDHTPLDPWGNAYLYRSPGETGPFDLVSYGADGKPGGEGLDADISYRRTQ